VRMSGSVAGSCPVVGFDIGVVEPLGSAATEISS
jgi:hypothetical protein